MRAHLFASWTLLGLAAGHAIERRDPADAAVQGRPWHPITTNPAFFNLKVNDRCDWKATPPRKTCPLAGYGIRLEGGVVIATPYDKWWDPTVATFFVDDDTSTYTVSKDPLQLYVNSQTGQLQYTRVGWLPPKAIALHFFHTGRNPLGNVVPTSSYFTWPSTPGNSPGDGLWAFCPNGETGQYEVFVNDLNFESAGVSKAPCEHYELAAVDANPWRKKKPHHWKDGPGGYDDE